MEEEQRSINSESLSQTRDILNALRKQTEELVDQKDLKSSLRSLATRINNAAQKSVALSSKNVTLLTDEKDIQKEISSSYLIQQRLKDEADAAEINISVLGKKNLDLQKKINDQIKIGNDEGALNLEIEKEANEIAIKTLSRIGDATNALREEVRLYRKEAIQASQDLKKIEGMPSVKLFTGLKEATKNIPFLSTFFDEAADRSKEIAKDAQRIEKGSPGVAQQSLEEALKHTDELTEDFINALDERTGIIKKAGLRGEDGKILTGEKAKEKIGPVEDIGKFFPKPNKFIDPLKGGFKDLLPIIKKALGPLFIITEFIDALKRADTEVVELQKSFAASRGEAMGIRTELADAADASGNFNITATKLLGTLTSISDQFGFIAKFSADTLVTATKLTEVVGISAEAAGQLAAASEATGTSLEQNYENVLGASYELQRQKGVQFDLRKILEATAKITGQVRANLGTNPELIAKAVTQAKLFGAEMSDIVASSRTLLDFQSSIESELEAELLIGRDLNLERARSAALMGDMATVAKELTEQAGDYTDFSKLNVIQQDALASAIGMQSDQLSDILFKQEIQGKTAKDLRALGKGELADRLESQTAADKFSATMDKLKGIVTDVAVAFMPILEIVGMIAEGIGAVIKAVGPLKGILSGAALGFATGGPVGAAIGAIAGGVSDAVNYQNTSESPTFADDAMIPSSHQGGKTLLGPEGSIKFNKDDDIVAGTNLFGDRSLSQMPDYESVLAETKTKINPISTIDTTSAINTGVSSTVNNNQTQINQESEELLNQMKAMNAAINKQTEILAKGQNTIAQTKTKLQVGATDLGTQLNVNSFRIQ